MENGPSMKDLSLTTILLRSEKCFLDKFAKNWLSDGFLTDSGTDIGIQDMKRAENFSHLNLVRMLV